MKMNKMLVGVLIASALLSGCLSTKKVVEVRSEAQQKKVAVKRLELEAKVPDGFNFATQKVVEVNLAVPQELANAEFKIYDADPEKGGSIIAEGRFDSERKYYGKLVVGMEVKSLFIKSYYIGMSTVNLTIQNGLVTFDYATYTGSSEAVEATSIFTGALKRAAVTPLNWARMAPTNGKTDPWVMQSDNGLPNCLVTPFKDEVSQASLNMINAALPETKSVVDLHPEYFNGVYDTDTLVTTANAITTSASITSAAVEVTFVSEGAGFRNTLGYYTYPLNNPPKSVEEIGKITTIFANSSAKESGGKLLKGMKVSLGNIPVNYGIGWVLAADAWDNNTRQPILRAPTSDKNVGKIYYSNKKFNPDGLQHSILIAYPQEHKTFLGFEDLYNGGDKDYNDCIFTVNIVGNSPTPVPPPPPPPEPNLEYTAGTLAFEDLWPMKGDYDFNDLVVEYLYTLQSNGTTHYLETLKAEFNVKAIGADQKNGFGFEMDIPKTAIASVTGTDAPSIAKDANGLEKNQDKSVVVVFDNAFKTVNAYTTGVDRFVNTVTGKPKFTTKKIEVLITFVPNTIKYEDLKDYAPFNPFLIRNQFRNVEIHLADKKPTKLAEPWYLGQNDDDSNIATGKYYKTENNLPWALNINSKTIKTTTAQTVSVVGFQHAEEFVEITNAYPNFMSWVNSTDPEENWLSVKDPSFLYQ